MVVSKVHFLKFYSFLLVLDSFEKKKKKQTSFKIYVSTVLY